MYNDNTHDNTTDVALVKGKNSSWISIVLKKFICTYLLRSA